MKYVLVGLWCSLIFCGMANAHDMIPTYPKFTNTFVTGVLKTKMEIFNKREDVSYYELGAFDAEWNPIPFVTSYKLIKMDYLAHAEFDIYIKQEDKPRLEYICSKSKLMKDDVATSAIASRICSRVK